MRKIALFRPLLKTGVLLLGPSHRSLVENFCAVLNKLVSEAFLAGSIGSQFHACAAVSNITIRFLEGATPDDGNGSTKAADVVDPAVDPEII